MKSASGTQDAPAAPGSEGFQSSTADISQGNNRASAAILSQIARVTNYPVSPGSVTTEEDAQSAANLRAAFARAELESLLRDLQQELDQESVRSAQAEQRRKTLQAVARGAIRDVLIAIAILATMAIGLVLSGILG